MSAPLLLHVFPSFAVGGAQVRFAAVANHFGSAYRHAIVAMDGDHACRERLNPGLDVSFPDPGLRKGDTAGNLRRIRRFLGEIKPSTMVTSNWGAIEWAMANLVPVVRHVHMEDGFGPDERAGQLPRRVWTRRIVLRRATVMLPSRTLLRIAAEVWRLPARCLRYVPNGVDLARFASVEPRAASTAVEPKAGSTVVEPKSGSTVVIGTVAALRAEKNVARLLRAFAGVQSATQDQPKVGQVRPKVGRTGTDADAPARLVVVGDGLQRPDLQRLAAELGIADRVRFAGHIAAPAAEYAGFDVFALSSDTEQMPLSVLEAMAAGLPVVSTDVGDVRAMLAEENAPYLVPRDDAALTAALTALLRDPAEARRVGAANRAKAERDFGEAAMFRSYAALFDGTA